MRIWQRATVFPTGRLNEAVRRSPSRFPADFRFQLTTHEAAALISQIAISNTPGRGGRRKLPNAFPEHGVAMLSSVLKSERAVAVNSLIMRTFVRLRRAIIETKELGRRMDGIERRVDVHGAVLDEILKALAPSSRRHRQTAGRSASGLGRDRALRAECEAPAGGATPCGARLPLVRRSVAAAPKGVSRARGEGSGTPARRARSSRYRARGSSSASPRSPSPSAAGRP